QSAAGVRDEQEDDLEACFAGCLHRRTRLVQAEIVELADGRVSGREHLAVGVGVERAHALRCLPRGLREHQLTPGPEVAAAGPTTQRALERVAVSVDESGQRDGLGHAATLSL